MRDLLKYYAYLYHVTKGQTDYEGKTLVYRKILLKYFTHAETAWYLLIIVISES